MFSIRLRCCSLLIPTITAKRIVGPRLLLCLAPKDRSFSSKSTSKEEPLDGKNKKRRKGNNPKGTTPLSLSSICTFSPELASIVGKTQDTRQAALKGVWSYIKEKNLQDPSSKRFILPDAPLKSVLGGLERVSMYTLCTLMKPHITS